MRKTSELVRDVKTSLMGHIKDMSVFREQLENSTVERKKGRIVNAFYKDNFLYASIEKNYPAIYSEDKGLIDEGFGLFNLTPEKSRALLYIRTNIKIDRDIDPRSYIGAECEVVVKKGLAFYATVKDFEDITIFSKEYLAHLMSTNPDSLIFTPANEERMRQDGFTDEQISTLKENVMSEEEEKGSQVIVTEGQATFWTDTSKKLKDVYYLGKKNRLIYENINEDGMKSNECHLPTSIFSAK